MTTFFATELAAMIATGIIAILLASFLMWLGAKIAVFLGFILFSFSIFR